MAGLPHMRVLVPADYAAAVAAICLAAETPGPVYVRMGRASVPAVYADGVELEARPRLHAARGPDVTIVACGVEVEQALAAADELAAEGVSAEVIDAFSVKPLDRATIVASGGKTGRVVVAEEHSIPAAWARPCRVRLPSVPGAHALRGHGRPFRQIRRVRGASGILRLGLKAIVKSCEKPHAQVGHLIESSSSQYITT